MDKRVIKPEVAADTVPKATRYAYYMEPKSGGYQLHRLAIKEDVVIQDDKIEDPDGWPEVMGYIEAEFSKEHFSK